MAAYIYPAIFESNNDGTFTVTFPDLPGCVTEGKNLENALSMAQDALTQFLGAMDDLGKKAARPSAPQSIKLPNVHCFVTVVKAGETDRAVRRTVSLPKWMDDEAKAAGLSLSKILQDALQERL